MLKEIEGDIEVHNCPRVLGFHEKCAHLPGGFFQAVGRTKLRDYMRNLAIALIWASMLTFIVAIVLVITGKQTLLGIHTGAEGFSRASSNLALIAIALGVWFKSGGDD